MVQVELGSVFWCRRQGRGTAVSVGDGYWLTARHNLTGARLIRLRGFQGWHVATVVMMSDEATDLALLQSGLVAKGFEIRENNVPAGRFVGVKGYAFGRYSRDLSGVASVRSRVVDVRGVVPGHSGALVYDNQKRLAGIVLATTGRTGIIRDVTDIRAFLSQAGRPVGGGVPDGPGPGTAESKPKPKPPTLSKGVGPRGPRGHVGVDGRAGSPGESGPIGPAGEKGADYGESMLWIREQLIGLRRSSAEGKVAQGELLERMSQIEKRFGNLSGELLIRVAPTNKGGE